MEIVDERIAGASREIDCFVECFGRFDCEAVRVDHCLPGWENATSGLVGATGVPHKTRQPGTHWMAKEKTRPRTDRTRLQKSDAYFLTIIFLTSGFPSTSSR